MSWEVLPWGQCADVAPVLMFYVQARGMAWATGRTEKWTVEVDRSGPPVLDSQRVALEPSKGQVQGCPWAGWRRPVVCSVFPDPHMLFATARHERAAGVTPELLCRGIMRCRVATVGCHIPHLHFPSEVHSVTRVCDDGSSSRNTTVPHLFTRNRY